MKNSKEIIEFYKTDKISKRSFEAELSRLFTGFLSIDVVLDEQTSTGATNSSYIAMLIPEDVNGAIRTTLMIDADAVRNYLSCEAVDYILDCAERLLPSTMRHFASFKNEHKDTEVSFLDCITLYLNCYKVFFEEMRRLPAIESLVTEKKLDIEKMADVQMAIENGTEKTDSIIEYIMVHKLVPELALQKAEGLFQALNRPNSSAVIEDDKPVQNQWYAKMVSMATGTFNPEYHEDIDPNYIPKR